MCSFNFVSVRKLREKETKFFRVVPEKNSAITSKITSSKVYQVHTSVFLGDFQSHKTKRKTRNLGEA